MLIHEQASKLLRSMMTQLGFGQTLGLYTPSSSNKGKLELSDSAAQRVEAEIKVFYTTVTLQQCYCITVKYACTSLCAAVACQLHCYTLTQPL
jgi:ATP-dependent Zn protease